MSLGGEFLIPLGRSAVVRTLGDAEIVNDRVASPVPEDLVSAEFQHDAGEGLLVYQKCWKLLKAGH